MADRDDRRREELKRALGEEEPEEEEYYESDEEGQGPMYQDYNNYERRNPLRRGRVYGSGWRRTRVNWGFWLLVGAFLLFLITWFILKPMLTGG